MSLTQNPFDQEENLQSWFSQDNLYQNSKKSTLTKLKTTINFQQNIFMSIQDSYSNFIKTILKNSILASILGVLLIGGVAASAAELLAPTDFKPSTIIQKTFNPKDFENNQQKDKNPYTALKPDGKNDVAKLDKCDLSIKYPKQISDQNLVVYNSLESDKAAIYSSTPSSNISKGTVGYSLTTQAQQNYSFEDPRYINSIDITCSDKPLIFDGKDYGIENYESPLISYSRDQLQSLTGWFVTNEAEITDIKGDDIKDFGPNPIRIYFKYQNFYYVFVFSNKNIPAEVLENLAKNNLQEAQRFGSLLNKEGLYGNQIQIQFNSLVQSETNAQVIDKPKNDEVKSSDSLEKIDAQFKFIEFTRSSDEIYTAFFEDKDKQIFALKNVVGNDQYFNLLVTSDTNSNLFQINAEVTKKTQTIEGLDGDTNLPRTVQYEFTKINLIDKAAVKN